MKIIVSQPVRKVKVRLPANYVCCRCSARELRLYTTYDNPALLCRSCMIAVSNPLGFVDDEWDDWLLKETCIGDYFAALFSSADRQPQVLAVTELSSGADMDAWCGLARSHKPSVKRLDERTLHSYRVALCAWSLSMAKFAVLQLKAFPSRTGSVALLCFLGMFAALVIRWYVLHQRPDRGRKLRVWIF